MFLIIVSAVSVLCVKGAEEVRCRPAYSGSRRRRRRVAWITILPVG